MGTGVRQEIESSDEARIMEIIHLCAEANTADRFQQIAMGPLRTLLGFEIMVAGIGGISDQGNCVHKALNFGYPVGYFEAIRGNDGRVDSPLMKKWREMHEPILFRSGIDDANYPANWVQLFNKFELRNKIGHGVLDLSGIFSSFFIFSRFTSEPGARHVALVKLLVPHLHSALARALADVPPLPVVGKDFKRISERQREILYWMHEGKTNWEIATILGLTELNVKYHVDQIFLKLDVGNRVHAIAKATYLGLLQRSRNKN